MRIPFLICLVTLSLTAAQAQTPAPSTNTVTPAPVATMVRLTTYTVVSGDSLWKIAHKFGVKIKDIKDLNKLENNHLKLGQVLQIPPVNPAEPAPNPITPVTLPPGTKIYTPAPEVPPAKSTDNSSRADVPSTAYYQSEAPKAKPIEVASPAHVASGAYYQSEAPKAQPVDISELASSPETTQTTTQSTRTVISSNTVVKGPSNSSKAPSSGTTTITTTRLAVTSQAVALEGSSVSTSASGISDLGRRFREQALRLADAGIEYSDDWRPPGESSSWTMDCSNTCRYLYKVTTGLELPRTASDQYYQLHLQNKAWDVPTTASGQPDVAFLRNNLQPGDLLFWEYTYEPERDPPITHVMIFLGTNDQGQWIMAGSQSGANGAHHRNGGGPDIYLFDPLKSSGGYSTWMGMVHHKGRFCAYGRPISSANDLASNNHSSSASY